MQMDYLYYVKMIQFNVPIHEIPNIVMGFLDLVGIEGSIDGKISKEHRFYEILKFFENSKSKDWTTMSLPDELVQSFNELFNIVIFKKYLDEKRDGRPLMMFRKVSMIDSLCVEAMLLLEYSKRGYVVDWLSPVSKDPPDIRVYDNKNKLFVDFEVKCRNGDPNIDSAFDLMSKGLKSLKNRKEQVCNPAIIVVHMNYNLDWKLWLSNPEIQQRLFIRFSENEYKIVSGAIFSGGVDIKKGAGTKQTGINNVTFRSDVANTVLPYGFLNKSGKI
jgi:hypothetical protein